MMNLRTSRLAEVRSNSSLVPRCQCSPPANISEKLEQHWNQTGFSPDSIPWNSLNVSVRQAHSEQQHSHPHSQSHVERKKKKNCVQETDIVIHTHSLMNADLSRYINVNTMTATAFFLSLDV